MNTKELTDETVQRLRPGAEIKTVVIELDDAPKPFARTRRFAWAAALGSAMGLLAAIITGRRKERQV